MRFSLHKKVLGLTTASLIAFIACGGEEFQSDGGAPTGQSGSTQGSSGNSVGGQAGTAGVMGASGFAGAETSGTSGTSGNAGTAGTAGQPAGGSAGTAGGSAGTAGQAGQAGNAGNAGSGGAPVDCDPTETTQNNKGLFVDSMMGVDSPERGTRKDPLKTITFALQVLANDNNKSIIYLADGIYKENVTLPPQRIVRLEGGWKIENQVWTRNCAEGANQTTIIAAATPSIPTIIATDSPKGSSLYHLMVTNEANENPSPGDKKAISLVGLRLSGNSDFELNQVIFDIGPGPKGADSAPPPAGANSMCQGTDDCLAGSEGGGVMGKPGEAGPTPTAGTFTVQGYDPSDGSSGTPGHAGKNGVPPPPPNFNTMCFNACDPGLGTCKPTYKTVSSEKGTCGCSGNGGIEGSPGKGGGASIGIYAVGNNVQLSVKDSRIATGKGGDGSPGTDGGMGGTGTKGAKGNDGTCEINVQCGGLGCNKSGGSFVPVEGGLPGGDGGPGGQGGPGSGGTGGPSIPLVLFQGAHHTTSNASFVPSAGGLGANGSPNGQSSELLEVSP
jgi:hypothetical protein